MSIQDQLNYLLPSKATIDVIGAKTFSISVQNYKIPRVFGYISEQMTPKLNIPIIGNKMVYDMLEASFLVTENLESYIELHNWMRVAYAPMGTHEYDKDACYKDVILTIYSAQNNPILRISFKNAFPVNLDEVLFNTQTTDASPVKTKVEFAYQHFDIVAI